LSHVFVFCAPSPTVMYTLSLHDALPILLADALEQPRALGIVEVLGRGLLGAGGEAGEDVVAQAGAARVVVVVAHGGGSGHVLSSRARRRPLKAQRMCG